jgi:hypothetical protein
VIYVTVALGSSNITEFMVEGHHAARVYPEADRREDEVFRVPPAQELTSARREDRN